MLNGKKLNIKRASLRFIRWSRKPFAVFVGIKKNISIGVLAKGIVDRLLPKTNTLEIIVPHGSHLSLQQKSMDEVLSINDVLMSELTAI